MPKPKTRIKWDDEEIALLKDLYINFARANGLGLGS